MADPITLAVVTSAVANLCSEYVKGVVGEMGKFSFEKIAQSLGWDANALPSPDQVPALVATALNEDEQKLEAIREYLAQSNEAGKIRQIQIQAKSIAVGINYGTVENITL